MNVRRILYLTSVLLFLFVICTGLSGLDEQESMNILVISSYHSSLPWSISFQKGLDRAQTESDIKLNYFYETMDAIRLPVPLSFADFSSYLKSKYAGLVFDAVLADSSPANLFVHDNRWLSRTPRILYSGKPMEDSSLEFKLIAQSEDAVKKTFELALLQNPDVSELVVIEGSDSVSGNMMTLINPLLEDMNDISVRVISDFTIEELTAEVARTPADAIIISTLIFGDTTGRSFQPRAVLGGLLEVSRAPIYSFWSSLMGTGLAGGHLIDGETTAIVMVQAAIDFIVYGGFQDKYIATKTIFDWTALEAGGIDRALIPDDAVIINKPASFFVLHYQWVVTVFATLVFFLLIIVANAYRKLMISGRSMRVLLSEKEMLMKEIHHRTKNNLIILQSLISLQVDDIDDEMARGYLEDVGNRLMTLSLIHENLYQNDDITNLMMRDYITDLAHRVFDSMVQNEAAFKLIVDVAEI